MSDMMTKALALASQGWRVFPLEMNGKRPAHTGWRSKATVDPAKIKTWWAEQDYNIGIALDESTLVVDVDVRDGKPGKNTLRVLEMTYDALPLTYTVQTASGGLHLYFRVTNGAKFKRTLGDSIDLKGYGGFVVAPGSTIANGNYRVVTPSEIADLPAWVSTEAKRPDQVKIKSEGAEVLVELDTPSAIARSVDWLQRRAGEGDSFKKACQLKNYGISEELIPELMDEHWEFNDKTYDELAEKANHAYRFSEDAAGSKSPEAEFDAVVEVAPISAPLQRRSGIYGINWKDAKPIYSTSYLIKGVLDAGIMAVTYGDSNVGKTFVKLDQCFHIAAGTPWNGHKVTQGLVVYVAAEGGVGFLRRIEAFKKNYGTLDIPFVLVPCHVDMFSSEDDTDKLLRLIRNAEKEHGSKCVMVVIDTLARAMAGGDENTAVDMGKFVACADKLRSRVGAVVDIIHHTGKDASKGARGSSALRAATDTEIEIGEGRFVVTKQRDMSKSAEYGFKLVDVAIGVDDEGDEVASCVVEWGDVDEFEDKGTPEVEAVLEMLERLEDEKRAEIEADDEIAEIDKPAKIAVVSVSHKEWLEACQVGLKGARGAPMAKSVFNRIKSHLSQSNETKQNKQKQWFTTRGLN